MTDPTQDPGFLQDPYPAHAVMRSKCPVQAVPTGSGGHTGYLVTGYAEAREALGDARLSKDTTAFFADKGSRRRLHPAVAHTMPASDPPRHTRLRKLVTKAFTTGAVAELRPFITRVADGLLDRWPIGERFDFVAGLAIPLPVIVICELLGVPEDDRPDVRRWSGELFAAGRPDIIDAASHAMADCMTGLMAAKRLHPGGSLLDRLIAARDGDDGCLNEDELVSLAVLLLVAGHETTTHFLSNALLALLRHPDGLNRLRENPDEIPAALDELLRFDSPVSTATFRFTTEAVALGGTDIPAGVPVLIGLGAANRDPEQFPSPDRLDLDRDATAHLGFGHGIHRCVGAPLAKAEAEIALRAVLARFPAIRLAIPPGQLAWHRTRLVRGPASLPLFAQASRSDHAGPARHRGCVAAHGRRALGCDERYVRVHPMPERQAPGPRRALEGNEAVHGEYKVPGGKLVVVDLDVEQGALRNVRVAGDFFLEPDEAILAINSALEGAPSSTDTAGLAARITAGLPESTVMLGLTAEGVGIAVRRALARATEWSDYDWQLVHTEPQAPALHMALDEVLTAEVAAGRRAPTLRVWEWASPAVIIGSFQSLRNEVDPEGAAKHGVSVVRRISGGGAMFVEPLSTITYSLSVPDSLVSGLSFADSYAYLDDWVLGALGDMGIKAWYQPLNDIATDAGKIAGAAQKRIVGADGGPGAVLHHVTMSYDIDADKMLEVLRISKEKLSDKGTKSAKKRVDPLRRQTGLAREQVIENMIASFRNRYGLTTGEVTAEEMTRAEELVRTKFGTEEWTARVP